MAQGRGSAGLGIFTVAALLCLMVHTGHVLAATYTVGGSGGWTFNVDSWPKGKSFKAGDILGKLSPTVLSFLLFICLFLGLTNGLIGNPLV